MAKDDNFKEIYTEIDDYVAKGYSEQRTCYLPDFGVINVKEISMWMDCLDSCNTEGGKLKCI